MSVAERVDRAPQFFRFASPKIIRHDCYKDKFRLFSEIELAA